MLNQVLLAEIQKPEVQDPPEEVDTLVVFVLLAHSLVNSPMANSVQVLRVVEADENLAATKH